IVGFASMQALSKRNDDPQAASRPYAVDRDGFVLGAGPGALIIESEEHARARGAEVYAVLAGSAVASDAYHITAPEPEGLGASRALRSAMASDDIDLKDVVHVNATATSTPGRDRLEYVSMYSVF